ncbi:hypothetical protein [Roseisolibacter sp. H3M3-2]|uniref:hypothetical protein n=1 Tax=Roseisolibacter sp. H3M3-2 TaxID=3031323 RepID=UPI0023D9A066|nr:hypothetical protein [Roseisolibacter sp. H3M3-2]MDF1503024.1 hypothetical protein [Roseisolibacter sp. H3M3-2]
MTSLSPRAPRRLAVLLALAAAVAGACSEKLDGGAACPALCPVTNPALIDTVIDAVALDSTLAGFPAPGEASSQLLALEPGPDTLDVRAVVRFDSLPNRYFPPGGGDSIAVSTADSTVLSLRLDTARTRYAQPVTVEAYDVDTTAAVDTLPAALNALFRPGRRLGSTTLQPGTAVDSVRIRLSDSAFVAKATGSRRLRVGLRLVSGASARVAFATAQGTSTQGGRITFDPVRDTSYQPVLVSSASATPAVGQVAAGFRDYAFVAASARPAAGSDLVVGGVQGQRVYLRFVVPPRLSDSTTIVRATLELVQRPARGVPATDSVTLRAQAVVATDTVRDVRLAANLIAAPGVLSLDSLRVSPADSATRGLSLVALVRAWRAFPPGTQRAVVLRGQLEGLQAGELRFFSTEAARAVRPRLRLSYIPRTDFGLP